MLTLPDVTLVAMTDVNIDATIKALQYSSMDINFESILLISDKKPKKLPEEITYKYIEPINNINNWSYNIIYKLGKYIYTNYAILIHADGFIVNPDSWRKEFLEYDYIGAPWFLPTDDFSYRDINGRIIRVGNSVSLRSKRLIDLPVKLNLEWKPFHGYYHEDGFICTNYRHIYEKHGMKFADLDLAKHFCHGCMIPEVLEDAKNGIKPFMFHRYDGTNNKYPKFL